MELMYSRRSLFYVKSTSEGYKRAGIKARTIEIVIIEIITISVKATSNLSLIKEISTLFGDEDVILDSLDILSVLPYLP